MTGITYQVWRLCGIVFILLLPYVVWKRRLWFPGLAAMGLGVFGGVKFWPAMGGSMRVWDLLIVAGTFIILFMLVEGKRSGKIRSLEFDSRGKPHKLLMFLLMLLLFRMFLECVYSGEYYFYRVIRDFIISTIMPCTIILIHPPRDDAFKEILKGIGLGAFLTLLPAFTDVELFRYVWSELSSGYMIGFYHTAYRGNMWAEVAVNLAVVLACLGTFNRLKRKFYFTGVIILSLISVIPLSRRCFVSLVLFLVLYSIWLIKNKKKSYQKSFEASNLLLGIMVLCFVGWFSFSVSAKFERHNIQTMLAEFGPSSGVRATASRADLWKYTLGIWLEKPVIGQGYLGYGWVGYEKEEGTGAIFSRHIGAHNLFFDLLAKTGIIGIFMAIIFFQRMVAFMRNWLKLTRGDSIFYGELSMLSIYWISISPQAFTGGMELHRLGLIAILPCAIRLVVVSRAGSMKSSIEQRDTILMKDVQKISALDK